MKLETYLSLVSLCPLATVTETGEATVTLQFKSWAAFSLKNVQELPESTRIKISYLSTIPESLIVFLP